jgi:uncharacterized membrane protein YcaP (DUF421 family)
MKQSPIHPAPDLLECSNVLEIVVRVLIIYVVLTVLLRITGRREMSELRPMDLLTMLLVSETVSPALTGGDQSLLGGLVAAATLIGLSVLIAYATFKSRRVGKLLEGDAVVLIKNGHVDAKVKRRFRISDEELATALRQHGVASPGKVARAYVEPDGEITVLEKK